MAKCWNVYIEGKCMLSYEDAPGADALRRANAVVGEWLAMGIADFNRIAVKLEDKPEGPPVSIDSLIDAIDTAENALRDAYNLAYALCSPAQADIERAEDIVQSLAEDIKAAAEREERERGLDES